MCVGLYIHIPFCVKRCNYCNFYTQGGYDDVPKEYIIAVINEIKKYKPFKCKTVYFGGGTPSLMNPLQLREILENLDILPNAEITMEINPETVTLHKLEKYKQYGINRLSIGVQTVKEQSLLRLGRIHDVQTAQKAFENAKKVGFENISGDIILATDGYSNKELEDTIDALDCWGAKHISCYMLKIEENTPLYNMKLEHLPNEDLAGDFYLYACKLLNEKGFIQYEISNFAKDENVSQHNNLYWKLENYLGLGPGAHSCLNNKRFYYPEDLSQFLNDPITVFSGEVDVDDYIMLSLRLKDGLDLLNLKKTWGVTLNEHQKNILQRLEKEKYLVFDDNKIVLTSKGFLVQNTIITTIW